MNFEHTPSTPHQKTYEEKVHRPISKLEALTHLFGREFFVEGRASKSIAAFAEEYEFEIVEERNGWYLCSASEERLIKALEKKAAMVINGFLVMKFIGKPSALCIKDTVIGKQEFKKGYWYSPVDYDFREQIKSDFDAGKRKVLYTKGQWVRMRRASGENFENISWGEWELHRKHKVKNNLKRLMSSAERYARNSSNTLPKEIDHLSREIFRKRREEML